MLFVCPWAEVDAHVEGLEATHVISLLGSEGVPATPAGLNPDRHLYVEIDDIATPIAGYVAPGVSHVEALLDFARDWNRSGPLIVHCFAGISRSTAAALAIMSLFNPGQEAAAARVLRQRAPYALPNRRILSIADDLLELDGRLVQAVQALGPRPEERWMGRLIELPVYL
ncbi:MAG TPA: tyrosine protein phosphatase [Alphaproteobacteria bacterium]|nr:tyrosine protein phosphatase [Alphaproteobacteria bacterium]